MCYFDCRNEIRALGISIERSNKIMSIIGKYYTPNDCVESEVEERVEEKTNIFEKKMAEAQKIIDNPQMILSEIIKKIVCEHLSLSDNFEPYAGSYARLNWDDKNLGEVCIKSDSDD